jgi:hypothetical protein
MEVVAHCGPTFRILSILPIRAVLSKDILKPRGRYVTSVTKYVGNPIMTEMLKTKNEKAD